MSPLFSRGVEVIRIGFCVLHGAPRATGLDFISVVHPLLICFPIEHPFHVDVISTPHNAWNRERGNPPVGSTFLTSFLDGLPRFP